MNRTVRLWGKAMSLPARTDDATASSILAALRRAEMNGISRLPVSKFETTLAAIEKRAAIMN